MAGKIIADTIESAGSQISLNVGNVTILTASSTGLTLIPTTNVNVNLTNSIVTLTNGSATSPGLTFSGNTRTGLFMPSANTLAFTAANTESMRIDSSGNVGIGTSSPAFKLEVVGATNNGIHIKDAASATVYGGLFTQAASLALYARSNHALNFGTNDTEQARITAAGLFQFNSGYGSVATAYGCRAWVNFNGTGVVAIRASGNVSSITDNGTGLYTVNFTTALPDVNYSSCCTGGLQSSSGTNSAFATSINKGTSTFQMATRSGSNADQDQDSISVAIFR